MNLILYTNSSNGKGKRLRQMIESTAPKEQVETFMTVNALGRKLRQPVHGVAIAVLLVESRQELLELISLKDLFKDIRIILILPDSKSETITIGHKLGPRFISYDYGNYQDVGMVLQKMVAYLKSNALELQL